MKYKYFLVLLALIFSLGVKNLSADCGACSESYKVKLKLNTDDTITGYIQWNSNYDMEDYISENMPRYIKAYVKKWDLGTVKGLSNDVLFEHWTRLTSLALAHKYKGFPTNEFLHKYQTKKYNFYINIEKFPDGSYGTSEPYYLSINATDIVSITAEEQDLHVSTTGGLNVFSDGELKLLRSGLPKYKLEFECSVSDIIFRCYNPKYSFKKFIDKLNFDTLNLDPDCGQNFYYKDVTFGLSEKEPSISEKFAKNWFLPDESDGILYLIKKLNDRKEKSLERRSKADFSVAKKKLLSKGILVQEYSWD